MSGNSKIEWTESTWNPVTGCTKVSQGCHHCYAERLAPKVFAGQTVEIDTTPPLHPEMKASAFRPRAFTDVRCHPERLDAPLHWKKPRRIFVNSMSDLFHEDVPDEFISAVFGVMLRAPQHTFQVLTKRPGRMLAFMKSGTCAEALADAGIANPQVYRRPLDGDEAIKIARSGWPPPNVWLGISCEDQPTADERIPLLLQTPAAVRFLSCEPLLGPIDLESIDAPNRCECYTKEDSRGRLNSLSGWCYGEALEEDGQWKDWVETDDNAIKGRSSQKNGKTIDWVIAGGESGPKARPSHPDWFRSLRDQCATARVPYFFKQWGEFIAGRPGDHHLPFDREPDHCWMDDDDYASFRVGKKAAGRLLDGKLHDEYPA